MNMSARGAFAAAVLAGVPYMAPAQTAAPATAVPTESIQIKASTAPAYRLAPQEFYNYARPYLLDNGVVIHFYERRHKFYTQLYNEEPVEIFAQAPGRFVTALGAQMAFTDDGDTIAVTHLDRVPYTGIVPISSDRVYMASR
jgi:hypothetical protein